MEYTEQELNFLKTLKEKGVDQDTAFRELKKRKLKEINPVGAFALETVEAAQKAKAEGKLDKPDVTQLPGYTAPLESLPADPAAAQNRPIAGAPMRFIQGTVGEVEKRAGQVQETAEALQKGEISPITGGTEFLGATTLGGTAPIKGTWDAVFPAFEPVLSTGENVLQKMTAPAQEAIRAAIGEEKVQEITQGFDKAANDIAVNAIQWYSGLDDNQKREFDIAVSFVDRMSDVIGLGAGKKAGKIGLEAATEGVEQIAKNLPAGETIKETVKETLSAPVQKVADILEAKKVAKETKAVTKVQEAFDSLITSNKALNNAAKKLESQGSNVTEIIKEPKILEGLKIKDKSIVPDEAIATVDELIDKAMDVKSSILPKVDELTPKISKEKIKEYALRNIEDLTEADQLDVIKLIDKQLAPLADELLPSTLDQFRAKVRKSARDAKGALKQTNQYTALEKAARDLVFEAADDLPIDKTGSFAQMSQYIKDLIATKQFLDKTLRAKKVQGGQLTKLFDKTFGAVAGSQAGPLGSVMGAQAAGFLSDILRNNQLGEKLKRDMIEKMFGDDPAALKAALEALEEIKKYNVPELGVPTTEFKTQMGSGKPIELPKKTQSTVDVEEVSALSGGQ